MAYNTTSWATDGNTKPGSSGTTTMGGTTLYKEFGLFFFTPVQGYHHPLVSNTMMFSDSGTDYVGTNDFGNSSDPGTSLDMSGTAVGGILGGLWFIEDNINIDEVRVIAQCESAHDLNFHLFSYDFEIGNTAANGDLTNGTLLASTHIVEATSTAINTVSLSISSATVAAGKAVYAFVENTEGTGQITCQMIVKYHLT